MSGQRVIWQCSECSVLDLGFALLAGELGWVLNLTKEVDTRLDRTPSLRNKASCSQHARRSSSSPSQHPAISTSARGCR